MNKFDDVFKDKLEKEEIPFQEAHWLAAKKLIDARKKRKRRFFFILPLIGLAGLASIFLWNTSSFKSTNDDRSEYFNSNSINSLTNNTTAEEQTINPLKTEEEIPSANVNSETETEISKSELKNELNRRKTQIDSHSSGSIIAESKQSNSVKNESKSIANAGVKSNQTKSPAKQDLANLFNDQQNSTASNSDLVQSNLHQEERNLSAMPLIQSLIPFEIDLPQSAISKPLIEESKTRVEILPVQNSFMVDLLLGGRLNPYAEGNSLIGANMGIGIQYKFKNSWSIDGSLNYLRRTGTFQNAISSSQVNYSFGRIESKEEFMPQALNYLEIPVGLVYSINKQNISMGVFGQYLLNVEGEKTFYKDANLVTIPTSKNYGVLNDSNFNSFLPGCYLGYEYGIKRLAFGVKANYLLKDIYQGHSDITTPLVERNALSFELLLKIHLFKIK